MCVYVEACCSVGRSYIGSLLDLDIWTDETGSACRTQFNWLPLHWHQSVAAAVVAAAVAAVAAVPKVNELSVDEGLPACLPSFIP